MTVNDTWSVQVGHVWCALMWGSALGVMTVGLVLGSEDLARFGLFVTGVSIAYTVCASVKGAMSRQLEAFEYGREVEREAQQRVADVVRLQN